jgi:threonine dehydrogenase-like Zn-dependent dehydrogenase
MGHELAVEVIEVTAVGFSSGEICVVNPYLSCGTCVACKAGKLNCCVSISVLGVHQDGGLVGLLSVPETNLIKAQGLTADECASVEFLSIGAHAVRRGGVSSRDGVLVVGAGPIGLGVALFARAAGASVVVLDRDAERATVAQSILGFAAIQVEGDVSEAVSVYRERTMSCLMRPQPGGHGKVSSSSHGGRYVLVGSSGSKCVPDADFHRRS